MIRLIALPILSRDGTISQSRVVSMQLFCKRIPQDAKTALFSSSEDYFCRLEILTFPLKLWKHIDPTQLSPK